MERFPADDAVLGGRGEPALQRDILGESDAETWARAFALIDEYGKDAWRALAKECDRLIDKDNRDGLRRAGRVCAALAVLDQAAFVS